MYGDDGGADEVAQEAKAAEKDGYDPYQPDDG